MGFHIPLVVPALFFSQDIQQTRCVPFAFHEFTKHHKLQDRNGNKKKKLNANQSLLSEIKDESVVATSCCCCCCCCSAFMSVSISLILVRITFVTRTVTKENEYNEYN